MSAMLLKQLVHDIEKYGEVKLSGKAPLSREVMTLIWEEISKRANGPKCDECGKHAYSWAKDLSEVPCQNIGQYREFKETGTRYGCKEHPASSGVTIFLDGHSETSNERQATIS